MDANKNSNQSISKNDNEKILRNLENTMRGLYEEIQVGEISYTTSEVYEMLEREVFESGTLKISQ